MPGPGKPPKRAPVDTVALKKSIGRDAASTSESIRGSVDNERAGHPDIAANDMRSAVQSGVRAGKQQATLDSARAGQIPAAPAAVKRPVNRDEGGAPIFHSQPDGDDC